MVIDIKNEEEIRKARDTHLNNTPTDDKKEYWKGVLFAYNWVLEEIQ